MFFFLNKRGIEYVEKQMILLSLVFPKSYLPKFIIDSVTTENKSPSIHKVKIFFLESKGIKDFNYNLETKQTNFIK